ncbi:hypothetical protein T484DRAFT_1813708 [Baffinella frigidus]|nr:hypothetical protein T484DRAFT_1813708 [Cryptophyta sp. CCMP2293]
MNQGVPPVVRMAFLPSLEPQLADPQLRQTSALRGNATASLHDLRNGAWDGND